MSITLVEVTKNTRGANSREIKYKAIGRWVDRVVERDTRPAFNPDGTKKLDDKGNEVRLPLEKDAEGKNIYVKETVKEFETDGVVTDLSDALELVNGDEQVLLDCFAEGFNERAYSIEANKDELDEFLKAMSLNDEAQSAFKRTVRQLAKNTGEDLLVAAEMTKAMMERVAAKKAAQAAKA